MRLLILSTLLVLTVLQNSIAQMEPVKWSFEVEKVNENEFDVIFIANIDQGWSVYSQHLDPDNGPIPTSFQFTPDSNIELIGQPKEFGNKKEAYDTIFEMNLVKFTRMARFTQRIKVSQDKGQLKGYLTYMTCNDKSCLPPADVDFDIVLGED
ncbi:MAG: protein-disulfide reductase DsbD domain-containing protein [Bacteroidota bacterium]